MKKQNLFSIGAMRAGSTSLYHYLSQHPDIFIPHVKEPGFFAAEKARKNVFKGCQSDGDLKKLNPSPNKGRYHTKEAYESLYFGKDEFEYWADCSHYLNHPEVAELIYQYNPQAKILISLRDPTERIYSEYMLYARRGTVSESFSDFVEKMLVKHSDGTVTIDEKSRLNKGLYHKLVSPWLSHFSDSQVKIVLIDDLKANTSAICQEIYAWLCVDETFKPELVRTLRGGITKSKVYLNAFNLSRFLPVSLKQKMPTSLRWKIRDLIYSKTLKKEIMSEQMRTCLKQLYYPSVCELEKIINRNLDAWK